MSKADFEKTLGNAASNLRHVSAWIGRGEGFKSRIDQFLSQTQASLSETKNYPMSQSNPLRLQINKLTSLLDEIAQTHPREKGEGEKVLYLSVRLDNLRKLVSRA